MSEFELNWNDVPDGPPPPPPADLYKIKIASAESTEAKSGNKMISLVLEILGKSNGEDAKGKIYSNVVFSEGSLFRVKNIGLAAGVDLPSNTSAEQIEQFADALVGVELHARTKLSPDNRDKSRMRADIDRYFDDAGVQEALAAKAGTGEVESPEPRRRRRSAA